MTIEADTAHLVLRRLSSPLLWWRVGRAPHRWRWWSHCTFYRTKRTHADYSHGQI